MGPFLYCKTRVKVLLSYINLATFLSSKLKGGAMKNEKAV